MGILWVLKSIFSLSIKAYFLYKASKIVFHDLFSLSITLGYRGLKGVTGGYKGYTGLKKITRGHKGSKGVRGGYIMLLGCIMGYRNFFL